MIRVDNFEPQEILALIAQSVESVRLPLNNGGFADYLWQDHQGDSIQVERKQWGEILSDIDGIEEQLRREFPMTSQMYLLIEGIIAPSPNGLLVYKPSNKGPILVPAHEYGSPSKPQPFLYARLMAWLWALDKAGITIVQTPNLASTAKTLVALYQQHQKTEHSVLNRYIKPRIALSVQSNVVKILMGLPGLGENRAQVLAEHFGSVARLVNADEWEIAAIPGFGDILAKKILAYLWEI